MECEGKKCPTNGSYLGCHQIDFTDLNPLHIKFANLTQVLKQAVKKTDYKMKIEEKICQNVLVHMGNNHFESDINKAIKTVMRRDWPHLSKEKIGQIFVPKIFLSKYPEIIDYEAFLEKVKKIKESPKKSQNETELLKKVDLIKGEKTEKKVYKAIKNLFARLNEDVLVIHGLKCMQLKDQDEIEYEEKDFLIINLTKRYVMSLEVKSSLSKNSLKSAKKQVNRAKRVIDEWLGATFTKENGWMFLGVICFDEKDPKYCSKFCGACDKYIILGKAFNIGRP